MNYSQNSCWQIRERVFRAKPGKIGLKYFAEMNTLVKVCDATEALFMVKNRAQNTKKLPVKLWENWAFI